MRYTLLGQSGLRVSELALGTMTFGTDWGWGASESESAKQFELFAEAGGTLIDTANRYTDGSAETILGDLLAADRDHFVVGTKYSLNTRDGDLNAGGNHRKNLVQALEASLRRLRTDYLDVLWLHAWDYLTPAEEVMRSLDDQVRLGKVLYLGISDTPAWVVAQLQTLAAARGWSTFAGLQIEYSLVQREVERELIPMARGLGLGVLAWGPLGAGVLSGKYASGSPERQTQERRLPDPDPTRLAIARTVADVAGELGLSSAVVALAWLRAQGASSRSWAPGPRSSSPTTSPASTPSSPKQQWPDWTRPATSPAASRTTSWPAPTSSSAACRTASTCPPAAPATAERQAARR